MSTSAASAAMPAASPPRLSLPWIGFFTNDPEYAPFGIPWLRGVTPLRLALFLGLCCVNQIRLQVGSIAMRGLEFAAFWSIAMAYARWLPMLVLIIRTEAITGEWPPARRAAALAAAITAGAAISQALGVATMAWIPYEPYCCSRLPGGALDPVIRLLAISGFFSLTCYGAILTAVLWLERRARETERRIHEARLAHVALERQAAEAQLRLLDAQIEPHFMFNTLASAKRICESDPSEGRALLRDLIAYLREAAPRSRMRETTLAEEAALVHSLLGIFKVRMGARLRFAVDIPEELGAALIPPLMLGTLVENAIKHGIGPRASGGMVRIAARLDGGTLVVEVDDDGVGFREHSGHGVGLANVRARLATLFGAEGSLRLASNPDAGVTATLRIPYRTRPESRS
ncbi:MAG: sensor histidine kinase [Usitatibacter sp.]